MSWLLLRYLRMLRTGTASEDPELCVLGPEPCELSLELCELDWGWLWSYSLLQLVLCD